MDLEEVLGKLAQFVYERDWRDGGEVLGVGVGGREGCFGWGLLWRGGILYSSYQHRPAERVN